jgi:hypothetical protein
MPADKKKTAGPASPIVQISVQAVLSFLKETRGMLTWSLKEMAKSLKISIAAAKHVTSVLQLQGYVAPAEGTDQWLTTEQGNMVSGSAAPRYTRKRVEEALASLRQRIKSANNDSQAPYTITDAVAFGDFLNAAPRVQAPDVGVRLSSRKAKEGSPRSAIEHAAQRAFLKQLQGRNAIVHVQPYEDWMSARSHRKLL